MKPSHVTGDHSERCVIARRDGISTASGPLRPLRILCVLCGEWFLFFCLAFEEGDKEAVGAVRGRGQAEIIVARGPIRLRIVAADRLGPSASYRVQHEIAVRVEESLGLRLVLLAQQRAGRINQPAARLYEARRAVEDRVLTLDQFGEILRRAAPFGIRVAAPAADAEARRIDKHAVEAAFLAFWGVMLDPGIALAGQRAALDIADAGAAQPLPGALQAPFRRVAGNELAAVSHRRGERQRLAACAGAEIDDAHPGTRIGEKRGDLRAFVLHLDETVLEGGGAGEWHAMRNAQPKRRPAGRVGVDMLGGESAA